MIWMLAKPHHFQRKLHRPEHRKKQKEFNPISKPLVRFTRVGLSEAKQSEVRWAIVTNTR